MTSFEPRFINLPANLLQRIAEIDEITGEWRYSGGLGPQLLGRLKRSVLVTSTGASIRIEGARLTDDDVERLIRGPVASIWLSDAQEARGYFDVLQLVFDAWDSLKLSEGTIKDLHQQLLIHVGKDGQGRDQYTDTANQDEATDRQGQVVSGGLLGAALPYRTEQKLSELVAGTNQELDAGTHHPLLVIANFVVEFLKIHPYLDGNGRLSRILTNLLLLRAGYSFAPYVSHEHLIEANKTNYYLALRQSQVTFGTAGETIEPWLDFLLDVCHRQALQAIAMLSAEAITQLLSPAQRKVWDYLLTVDEAAPREIAAGTDVPLPTVAQALDKLLALGKVERLGLGRATRYRRGGGGAARTAA